MDRSLTYCAHCELPFDGNDPERERVPNRRICRSCYHDELKTQRRVNSPRPRTGRLKKAEHSIKESKHPELFARREQLIEQYAADVAKHRPIAYRSGYLTAEIVRSDRSDDE